MTDNTSAIAGNYQGGIRITCILDEGNPTVTSSTYASDGTFQAGLTFATELEEGDVVALSNNTACTYAACGGLPVVEKPLNTETLVLGMIVSKPKLMVFPASSTVADSLTKRLAAKYYRVAEVEIWGGITKVIKATVMQNGSNACVPGVGTTLVYNITSGYSASNKGLQFDSSASNGVGVIPMHYAAAGTDGDTISVLVGITGLLYAVTGA